MKPSKVEKKKDTFPERIEEDAESLAVAVAKVSRGMEVLTGSRLKRKAILLLLSHSSKIPQRDVDRVLQALSDLERDYLK